MKYLLESNICIHFFRGKFGIMDKLTEIGIDNCAISEITLAELVFGAEKSNNPEKNHNIIDKFTINLPYYQSSMQFQPMEKRKRGFRIREE